MKWKAPPIQGEVRSALAAPKPRGFGSMDEEWWTKREACSQGEVRDLEGLQRRLVGERRMALSAGVEDRFPPQDLADTEPRVSASYIIMFYCVYLFCVARRRAHVCHGTCAEVRKELSPSVFTWVWGIQFRPTASVENTFIHQLILPALFYAFFVFIQSPCVVQTGLNLSPSCLSLYNS